VLTLTAHIDQKHRLKSKQLEFNGFLTKPLLLEEAIQVLKQFDCL